METEEYAEHLKALLKLGQRLHTETEPGKLYRTLKKISSLPILCDSLAEVGFRQTLKLLRREQLLVPFAKEVAARWSERSSPLELHADPETQELVVWMRLPTEEAPRKPAAEDEAQEPAASRARGEGAREVVGGITRSPEENPDLYQAGSFEACLNYDCPSSSSTPPLGKGQKRKRPWKEAEAQSPGAKVPRRSRSESPNCKQLNLLPASGFPEPSSSRQARLPPPGQDSSSLQSEQEADPWACRMNSKTPVYSGRAPGGPLLPKLHRGGLAEPDCSRPPAAAVAQEEECLPQTRQGQPTHSQTEAQTQLQLQEARELRLQALRERIQRAQAKKSRARQTKLIAFPAQVASQSQQAASGPQGLGPGRGRRLGRPGQGGASSKDNSLPGALAPGQLQKAPRLPLGPSNKTQLKKSAPLMAKSLRDYNKRWSRS